MKKKSIPTLSNEKCLSLFLLNFSEEEYSFHKSFLDIAFCTESCVVHKEIDSQTILSKDHENIILMKFTSKKDLFVLNRYVQMAPPIPIITLSDGEDIGETSLEFGADFYISSTSIDTAELKKDINAVIAKQKHESALYRKLRAMEDFFYLTVHEIKNPLQKFSMSIEKMRTHPELPDELRNHIVQTKSWINLMNEYLNNMLDFAGAPSQETNLFSIDVNTLLLKLIKEYQLEYCVRISALPVVMGSHALSFVFSNIINNCIKFQRNDVPLEIQIYSQESPDHPDCSDIYVQDNGIGIRKKDQIDIFKPYKRFEKDVPGSGVGLFLCKKVIEGLGGKIRLSSNPGHGATIIISLPNYKG